MAGTRTSQRLVDRSVQTTWTNFHGGEILQTCVSGRSALQYVGIMHSVEKSERFGVARPMCFLSQQKVVMTARTVRVLLSCDVALDPAARNLATVDTAVIEATSRETSHRYPEWAVTARDRGRSSDGLGKVDRPKLYMIDIRVQLSHFHLFWMWDRHPESGRLQSPCEAVSGWIMDRRFQVHR